MSCSEYMCVLIFSYTVVEEQSHHTIIVTAWIRNVVLYIVFLCRRVRRPVVDVGPTYQHDGASRSGSSLT